MTKCPFCEIPGDRVVAETAIAIALYDKFPVAEGHTLVLPRRHVVSVYELTPEEQTALWQFVAQVREHLANQFHPDGFNIGTNDGSAAGQTVPHAHVHVIPRYSGDVPDPRGGMRWVISDKAAYWETLP